MTLAASHAAASHAAARCLRAVCACIAVTVAACSEPQTSHSIAGATMGTQYHVTWVDPESASDPVEIKSRLDQLLLDINASMSTYQVDSEIVRFNASTQSVWFPVSDEFLAVLEQAASVASASEGRYDVTIGPLVDVWGFGPRMGFSVPAAEDITAARQRVGLQHIEVDAEHRALRRRRDVELDFSSIAKGYAVDRISQWLGSQGFSDHMVEVGGELKVSGSSPRQTRWRIAIETPRAAPAVSPVATQGSPAEVLEITDVAVATSGDYRNYFEADGKRYSHMIDPRTGWPVEHDLASVTVLHSSAALADAWATALAVSGRVDALRLATDNGLAVYLMSEQAEGWRVDKSPAFEAYLR